MVSSTTPSAYTFAMVRLARLRQLREQAFLTQRELAERVGMSPLTITKLELGQQQPRPSTVRKLARALRVKPAELLG